MPRQQITLYSSNDKIARTIRNHWENTSFEVIAREGRPTSADFVVTLGAINRPIGVLALTLGAAPACLPEALYYLAAQAHLRGGLTLVGSDRKEA